MTGTRRDSNTSTQCPSSIQLDTLDQPSNNTRSSNSSSQQHQQYDTPRAKRFSQKLVEAAKKQPLARTPSTSASLSPPLESCMADDNDDDDDDESMVDIDSSCFASPNRDDQIMNSHFQNLLLSSPLRPDLTMMRPLQLDDSHPSSSIPDDHSEPNGVLNRRRLQDKRPVKHQPVSDSPSLSAKPKRRKLKQQRTTSWRMGADATLDTNKIHLPVEPSQPRPSSPTPPSQPLQQQGNARRSSRLANRKISYGETMGIASNKKPLVVLGIPGGVKTESEQPAAPLYDDGDYSGRSVSNEQQQQQQQRPPRKIRRRVDTVEKRLNQLIFARDTLDLSQHSVLPTSGNKAQSSTQKEPSVVVIDDSGSESDDHATASQTHATTDLTEPGNMNVQHKEDSMETTSNDDEIFDGTGPGGDDENTLHNKVKLEPVNKPMDLSSSPLPTISQPQQQDAPVSTESEIDEDSDMAEINESGLLNGELPATQTPPTDSVHTRDEHDDDLVMADEQRTPSIQDSASQDIPASAPSSPSFETKDDQHLNTTNTLSGDESSIILDTASTTIRAPSLTPSPSSATPPELNDPLLAPSNALDNCSATNQDTASTNDDNNIQPPASASASASSILSSSNLEAATSAHKSSHISTNTPQLANASYLPSQRAKDLYTLLTNDENTTTAAAATATTTEGGITTLTEDQKSTTESTSTPSATEMDNSIGSSEGATLFGRLIGSASHFFLGN